MDPYNGYEKLTIKLREFEIICIIFVDPLSKSHKL